MQIKRSKKLYRVTLEFRNGLMREINVKAVDRPTAEQRALKFHPSAVRVNRNAP